MVTRLLARSPLRLLAPGNGGDAAWIFTSSYGGGMVAGDRVELDVAVGAGATALLSTQAQTKVYRGASEQHVRARVGEGGLLCWLPDPVVAYAGARWTQTLEVRLDGSLVLVEGLTAGRRARGERWAFERFASRVRVLAPELTIDDALLLDPAHGSLPERLGGCDALATVMALGPRAAPIAAALRAAQSPNPNPNSDSGFAAGGEALVAASDVPGGMLARVAGGAQAVAAAVRLLLADLPALLGDDPFARKW